MGTGDRSPTTAPPTSSPALRVRMLAGVPVTARTVPIAGLATSVLEGGDGPPLLLLHGGIECGGAMWAPVLSMLAKQHRLVVPDVPGLGESQPAERLDLETFAGWLTALIEYEGLEKPTLVAHSLVGSLAARLAARRALDLDRLVIYAGPAVGPYRMPWGLRYVAIRFAIRPSARNADRFDHFALLDADATRRRDPGWYEAFSSYTRARAVDPHVKRTMRQLISAETKPIPTHELDRIEVPTALLWGRHDRMVPLTIAQHAAAHHGWPLHVVEGAAHAPHIEQPEQFVDVLTAAMAR